MDDIKEYVYTFKDIDYQKYLDYAGLQIDLSKINTIRDSTYLIKRSFKITEKENANKLQLKIRNTLFSKNKL